MSQITNIKTNFDIISSNIQKLRALSPISSASISILAASKSQSAESIEEAIYAGITNFGENRVQETASKWPDIKTRHPDLTLHLIGPLQTNKVKQALALFDVIQTIDRLSLAEALRAELKVLKNNTTQHSALKTHSFYIQVNTGAEPQKSGILPHESNDFIDKCRDLGLPIIGLMCVPPNDQPPAPHFALLREIALRNGLSQLSMGMSDDYQTAISMGSSCIRIGTGLFGKRE